MAPSSSATRQLVCPRCGTSTTLGPSFTGDCDHCGWQLYRSLDDPFGEVPPSSPLHDLSWAQVPRPAFPIAKIAGAVGWIWMLHFITSEWWISAALAGMVLWLMPTLSWQRLLLFLLGSAMMTAYAQGQAGLSASAMPEQSQSTRITLGPPWRQSALYEVQSMTQERRLISTPPYPAPSGTLE